jgi:hypothetical protein
MNANSTIKALGIAAIKFAVPTQQGHFGHDECSGWKHWDHGHC